MTKCPYCAEEIQDQARKCRFCGEWLNRAAATVAVRELGSSVKSAALGAAETVVNHVAKNPIESIKIGGGVVLALAAGFLFIAFVIHPIAGVIGVPAVLVVLLLREVLKKVF